MTGSVLLAAYMLTLVLVLVGGIYAARRLTRPLADLAEGTERVEELLAGLRAGFGVDYPDDLCNQITDMAHADEYHMDGV